MIITAGSMVQASMVKHWDFTYWDTTSRQRGRGKTYMFETPKFILSDTSSHLLILPKQIHWRDHIFKYTSLWGPFSNHHMGPKLNPGTQMFPCVLVSSLSLWETTVNNSNVGEEWIYFILHSGSQSVIEESQGRNSRQEPWGNNACWLAQSQPCAEVAFLDMVPPTECWAFLCQWLLISSSPPTCWQTSGIEVILLRCPS